MAVTIKIIAKMHYFAGLTPDELEEVREYIAFEKKLEKGQTLLIGSLLLSSARGDQGEIPTCKGRL